MIAPISGRLVVRHLAEGTVLVGLLQLPAGIAIVEGAAYALRLTADSVQLSPAPVGPALDVEQHGWAMSDWLLGRAWFRTYDPEFLVVRFVQAFPDINAWAVCGVSAWPLDALSRDAAGHGWWEVGEGALRALTPPCDARGMAMGQLLTQCPVWPGPAGELHALSQVLSPWRPVLLRFHQLLVRAGRGEMTLAQAREQVRVDPELWQVGAGALDPGFCAYLVQLNARGGLQLDGPRTADTFWAHEQIAGELVAASA